MKNELEKINEFFNGLILLSTVFSIASFAQLMSDLISLLTDIPQNINFLSTPNLLGLCFLITTLILYILKQYLLKQYKL